MHYRLVGRASSQSDEIFTKSLKRWGLQTAIRYDRLIVAALEKIAADPTGPGTRPIEGLAPLRSYHLRSARLLFPAGQRVDRPRHFVVFRLGTDGVVEILGLVHERQLLARAARRARLQAAP